MSQEQIVIGGVIALNVVLLILLVTAYRLLSAKAPATATQTDQAAQAAQAAQIAQFAQQPLAAQHPVAAELGQHPHLGLPTEADEIQSLEALFAHDSWPEERLSPGGQLSARAIHGAED